MTRAGQGELFAPPAPAGPDGFRYAPDLISVAEEEALVAALRVLPLREFEFHGFTGKRRVVSFGWRYDFNDQAFRKTDDIPSFLLPLRDKAARFAAIASDAIAHALVTEYTAGAAIGWHKDRPVFDDVIGISLLSPCLFRFRQKAGARWARYSLTVAPRSVYLLRGPARTQWEHSIPAVDQLRYSITFRTLAARGA